MDFTLLDEPDNSSTRAYQAIRLGFIFGGRCLPRWNRSGLFWVRPDNSHCPVLTVEECWKHRPDNPKTDIVVAVGGIVVVAVGRATVRRIIVPRTAPFTDACPDLIVRLIDGDELKKIERATRERRAKRRRAEDKRARG
jgi:hypothetical protein